MKALPGRKRLKVSTRDTVKATSGRQETSGLGKKKFRIRVKPEEKWTPAVTAGDSEEEDGEGDYLALMSSLKGCARGGKRKIEQVVTSDEEDDEEVLVSEVEDVPREAGGVDDLLEVSGDMDAAGDADLHSSGATYRRHYETTRTSEDLSVLTYEKSKITLSALGSAMFHSTCLTPPQLSQSLETTQLQVAPQLGKLSAGKKDLTQFSSLLHNYLDVLYPNQSLATLESLRLVYTNHALRHCLRSVHRIKLNNEKLKKNANAENVADRGLTRAKVLLLLPFRESALRVVQFLISLLGSSQQVAVSNKKRFLKEFQYEGARSVKKKVEKPADFEKLFAGNFDDNFKIGLTIDRRSVHLYTDFYSSDLIIASPLGLKTSLAGAEAGASEFLSSIEVLIIDQADVLLMQNWLHLLDVVKLCNQMPAENHDVDFSRVRETALEGLTGRFRQTILLSSFSAHEFTSLMNKHGTNYAGKMFISRIPEKPAMSRVLTPLRHVFHLVPAATLQTLADDRFNYFLSNSLPTLLDGGLSHILIFVPSYFDFVRIKAHFTKEKYSGLFISEYTTDKKLIHNRGLFFHGKVRLLFYSERLHFYRRYWIRGTKHLLFYSLPSYAHYYSELCQLLPDPVSQVTSLYSKFDAASLVEIAGVEAAKHLVGTENRVSTITTGHDSRADMAS